MSCLQLCFQAAARIPRHIVTYSAAVKVISLTVVSTLRLQVPVFAMVTPVNRTQPTGKSRTLFNLGPSSSCPPSPATAGSSRSSTKLASTDSQLQLVASPPTVSSSTGGASFRWVASCVAVPAVVSMQHGQTAAVKFNVSWEKVAVSTRKVAGTVTVTNPSPGNTISLAAVRVKVVAKLQEAGAAAAGVVAECQKLELQPGGSTTCSYSTDADLAPPHSSSSSSSAGSSYIAIDAADKHGGTLGSTTVPLDSKAASTSAAAAAAAPEAAAESCAEVVAGLMLSPALSVPGAAGPMAAETFKACEAGSRLLSQPVGPLPANACGTYTVRGPDTLCSDGFSTLSYVSHVTGCHASACGHVCQVPTMCLYTQLLNYCCAFSSSLSASGRL
jgi:hypothetical protein